MQIPDLYFYTKRAKSQVPNWSPHDSPEGSLEGHGAFGGQCTDDCKHTLIVH